MFVCDLCRVEHPDGDLGKNVGLNPTHEDCTGRICRRCTYGDMNRAQRRAMGGAAICATKCK